MEVCLVNTTNPERISDFTVQFYTSYDSNTILPAQATGKATILNFIESLNFSIADLDYEALYRESDIIFTPDTNRACTIINTYHDNLEEGIEKFIVTSVRIYSSGFGQFSRYPQTTDILIANVNCT